MFKYGTPESVGIDSNKIKEYIKVLEGANLSTHDVIIMRNGTIVYENYWKPFHKDFLHRMYSVTKSFVSIAVGFLIQEGKITLDTKICDVFPPEITEGACENVRKQTIRNMLMMATGWPCGAAYFFSRRPNDRVRDYFWASGAFSGVSREPGTYFEYDSTGSFVMGAMVEELTGKTLMEYLREKFMDKIGVSREAYMLTCPGGHSWSDSALICKPTDLLKVANFCMHYGNHEGEQILNADYLKEATSNLIDVHRGEGYGYGYQFWTLPYNSFYFNGMGSQFAVCSPDKDMILICNADNQGNGSAEKTIINSYFELVHNTASDSPLPENKDAQDELKSYSESLELWHCNGREDEKSAKINGKTFVFSDNPMTLSKVRFTFTDDEGKMEYTNKRGAKVLNFAFDKNYFEPFPEGGYSGDVACGSVPDLHFKSANSAMWVGDTLQIEVQIIDTYFGRLHMYFDFSVDGKVKVSMQKIAEDFLHEYQGEAEGIEE
ncbi:MAG: serine hydrolase [Clostridia bacterium]|nr:serine hydrolase [Clostridia bacterium]